jgi:hypothetical protein
VRRLPGGDDRWREVRLRRRAEFDGHLVDWNNLLSRVQFYKEEEKQPRSSTGSTMKDHECNLDQAARGWLPKREVN